jgi:Holliday junction resolvase RusA-like endonuclease
VNPLVFTVYGVPVAQGRPRFFRRGNHVGALDPKKSRDYKSGIRIQAIEQLRVNGTMPPLHEGALAMQVHAYLPRPKTLPKRVVHHIKRPDADNIAKGCKDAMKGVVYKDDSQIVELLVRKSYGDPPRIVIGIKEAVDA